MKNSLFSYYFFFFLVLTYLVLKVSNDPNSIRFLTWILVIPTLYFLLQSVALFFRKLTLEGILSLSTGVIILLIYFKIWYTYYNFYTNWSILIVITLVLCFLIYKKKYKRVRKTFFMSSFILIGALFVHTRTDTTIFKFINTNVVWTQLNWSHFRGIPDEESEFAAVIKTKYFYKFNKVSNPPSYLIIPVMDPYESWMKSTYKGNLAKLLNHEQRHFDLAKVFTEKMKDSMAKIKNPSYEILDSVVEHYSKKANSISEKYDILTDHGNDTEHQKIWNHQIDLWLKKR